MPVMACVVQRGSEGSREFLRIVNGVSTWVANRDDARHFGTMLEANEAAERIVFDEAITIAVYPIDQHRAGPGPDRPLVHR